ncbi:MAG: DUF3987 domain-containing protein [Bacteroidales bacterium]|nr:DUF3987 domain-containing protein [Bacteroidales bacterium]
MAKDKFNPEEWLNQPAVIPSSTGDLTPAVMPDPDRASNDIETITQRIEATSTDITAGYDNWRDLGFALSEELGEAGRDYFHRISRFNPDYNAAETDKQYDRCLRAHGTGVTIKTFFQKAKEAGISIVTSTGSKSAISAISTKSAQTHSAENAEIAETAEIEQEEELPTFSKAIYDDLPDFLKKIATVSNSEADSDILLLGTLTVLSACMPHIKGVYDRRSVFPNLFLFVTARASSGKGRLNLCRHLVEPIHDRLREINEAEVMDYKHRLAEYNAAGKKKVDMEKPEEPPMRMLFIPANSSATAVYQVLNDNGGEGLMFETEGDTLANTFGSDYGNYSDGFRKAFHHETISYIRRKDREYVNIKQPKLSTLLTGTPRQILNLISDAENGLFSRFAFYYLDTKLVWNNVFANSGNETLEEYFQNLGKEYQDFFNILKECKDITFYLTAQQEADFNATFDQWQQDYVETCGEEFIATVRRLGVIMFRIAMCLSALRIMEDGNFEDTLCCLDQDYHTAKTIAEVLIQHDARVFHTLANTTAAPRTASAAQRQSVHNKFFETLPNDFDRKTYTDIATQMGLNPKSMDRIIRKWCDEGKLENISHGHYTKIN